MSINIVRGKLKPLNNTVLVTDMEFSEMQTTSGIFIPSQDGKSSGIKPRWGRVWAVGPTQKDVKVGEWVYVEHGRWTRGVTVIDKDGNEVVVRRVDTKDIMLTADKPPEDVYLPKN